MTLKISVSLLSITPPRLLSRSEGYSNLHILLFHYVLNKCIKLILDISLFIFFQDYQAPLFGTSLAAQKQDSEDYVSQALCLPVSVNELLQANQLSGVSHMIINTVIQSYFNYNETFFQMRRRVSSCL